MQSLDEIADQVESPTLFFALTFALGSGVPDRSAALEELYSLREGNGRDVVIAWRDFEEEHHPQVDVAVFSPQPRQDSAVVRDASVDRGNLYQYCSDARVLLIETDSVCFCGRC